jgi:uncharacterized protein (TIGR02453 family)
MGMITAIKKETFQFLKDIRKHNNRDWFNLHKDKFIVAQENFTQFVQALIEEVAKFDKSVVGLDARSCIFRIYRDIRFSKDKSPYKTHFEATLLGKGKGCGIAGYYIHLEPGHTFVSGGVHMTEPEHLRAIREEISSHGKEFLKIINDKNFKGNFNIEGEKLIKVPQGFNKEDPMSDYLKYKELIIQHPFDDKTTLSSNFIKNCTKVFHAMVPFNKFVNEPVIELA